jgi:hypothetical protein
LGKIQFLPEERTLYSAKPIINVKVGFNCLKILQYAKKWGNCQGGCSMNNYQRIMDVGYWILVAGYWLLVTGYWLLDSGYSILLIFSP